MFFVVGVYCRRWMMRKQFRKEFGVDPPYAEEDIDRVRNHVRQKLQKHKRVSYGAYVNMRLFLLRNEKHNDWRTSSSPTVLELRRLQRQYFELSEKYKYALSLARLFECIEEPISSFLKEDPRRASSRPQNSTYL